MISTTHERLRRTAAEAVGSIPGIEAVVLYGSRARGTARPASDWDVAILSHAAPEQEKAATRLFHALERVNPVVMKPESIEAHCNQGTRLESAVARQGRLLAGEWTPPCRIENREALAEDAGVHERLNLPAPELFDDSATGRVLRRATDRTRSDPLAVEERSHGLRMLLSVLWSSPLRRQYRVDCGSAQD